MVSAGAGRAEVNLAGVLPFDGFDAQHDAIYIRALLIENTDGGRACLVSVDATSLRDDSLIRTAAAKAANIAPEQVWIASTHTFSVPHVRTPEHLASDEERARNVLLAERWGDAAAEAVKSAASKLAPARFEVARGRCSVNVCRDVETPEGWWLGVDPAGFSDRSVRVLRVSGADGKPIAIVYTTDVQSSMVQGLRDSEGRLLVSGDLVGEASRELEAETGAVALFVLGAAADQAPSVRGSGALPELGSILAAEVISALRAADPLAVDAVKLSAHVVSLPGQRRANFASLAPTRSYQFEPASPEETTLHLARLGELAVVGIAPEVESRFAATLRDELPMPFDLLTMVNGAQKYLPCELAYERITYEAMNSGFARGAAERLQDVITTLVKEDHV